MHIVGVCKHCYGASVQVQPHVHICIYVGRADSVAKTASKLKTKALP